MVAVDTANCITDIPVNEARHVYESPAQSCDMGNFAVTATMEAQVYYGGTYVLWWYIHTGQDDVCHILPGTCSHCLAVPWQMLQPPLHNSYLSLIANGTYHKLKVINLVACLWKLVQCKHL